MNLLDDPYYRRLRDIVDRRRNGAIELLKKHNESFDEELLQLQSECPHEDTYQKLVDNVCGAKLWVVCRQCDKQLERLNDE